MKKESLIYFGLNCHIIRSRLDPFVLEEYVTSVMARAPWEGAAMAGGGQRSARGRGEEAAAGGRRQGAAGRGRGVRVKH